MAGLDRPRTRLRLRRRATALVAGAVALFLVGTNVQAGWLLVLSSLLLGAAAAGALLPRRMVRDVAVTRRAPPEAFVGDRVPIDLVVANRGRGLKLSITVRDPHVAPASVFVPAIEPGASVTVSTDRRASRRGVVDGGPVQVVSTAPFGVAEARRVVPAGGRTVVYPRVVQVGAPPLPGPGRRAGEHAAAPTGRGQGREFHGTREYQRGDSLRHVHWPSTARHGALIVREFEQERPAGLVVLVDTWADAEAAEAEVPVADVADVAGAAGAGNPESPASESVLDLCCSAAASLGLAALAEGHEVSVAAAREGAVDPPLPADRSEVLMSLARLRAPGGLSLSSVIEHVSPFLPNGIACLLAFPTWRVNAGLPAVVSAELSGRGVTVSAAVVDATGLGPAGLVLTRSEVEELHRELASTGVHVFRIGPKEDLAACLGVARPFAS